MITTALQTALTARLVAVFANINVDDVASSNPRNSPPFNLLTGGTFLGSPPSRQAYASRVQANLQLWLVAQMMITMSYNLIIDVSLPSHTYYIVLNSPTIAEC